MTPPADLIEILKEHAPDAKKLLLVGLPDSGLPCRDDLLGSLRAETDITVEWLAEGPDTTASDAAVLVVDCRDLREPYEGYAHAMAVDAGGTKFVAGWVAGSAVDLELTELMDMQLRAIFGKLGYSEYDIPVVWDSHIDEIATDAPPVEEVPHGRAEASAIRPGMPATEVIAFLGPPASKSSMGDALSSLGGVMGSTSNLDMSLELWNYGSFKVFLKGGVVDSVE